MIKSPRGDHSGKLSYSLVSGVIGFGFEIHDPQTVTVLLETPEHEALAIGCERRERVVTALPWSIPQNPSRPP